MPDLGRDHDVPVMSVWEKAKSVIDSSEAAPDRSRPVSLVL